MPSRATSRGIRLRLRVTPRASADRAGGLVEEPGGGSALKVQVTAPADAGRANEAVIALLAPLLGVAKRDIAIVGGAADRRKWLEVAGDPADLSARVEGLAAGGGKGRR